MTILANLLPPWLKDLLQNKGLMLGDLQAGLMMAILVIPQSLAYATLAGLPPVMGLYASIVPTLVYAYVGSSSVNALGPVAVTAIMTAGALSDYTANSTQYISLAITLAMLVGAIFILASLLRLGWIMQFVSRGVSSGFISAAAVLILISQLKNLIGTPISGDSLLTIYQNWQHTDQWLKPYTALVGLTALALLLANRYFHHLWAWLPKGADFAKRAFMVVVVVGSIMLANHQQWQNHDIRLLTDLPTQFPTPTFIALDIQTLFDLLPSAFLIALVGFISSSAVASNHARIHGQPFDNNKELLGLGLANIGSSIFGGFAVVGGISRTSLNIGLGAKTPFASVVCAVGILLILLFFGQYLVGLPYAILSAIIVSSVVSMIDIDTLKHALRHDKADALSLAITFVCAIIFGLNVGLITGLLASFALMIYRSHRVNVAVIGQVGDSEHFRDIRRHKATTFDNLLIMRIDESLYFGNASSVHDSLRKRYLAHPKACDIILVMTAVNHIDLSAQEMLGAFDREIKSHHKRLHFAEIKGPVMDTLRQSPLLTNLSGETFLSTQRAVDKLRYRCDDWHGM